MTQPDSVDPRNFRRILTRNLGPGSRESLDFSRYRDAFEPAARAERLYRKAAEAR